MASSLARLASWVAGRGRASSFLLAGFLGLLAAGALAPLFLVPLVVPAFVGLVWLLDGAGRGWRAGLIAWLFAFDFFLAGLYWVAEAFFVEAERFGAVAPFAVIGLSALLALFHALPLWAARRWFWKGPARVAAFALAWLLAEVLRGYLFTGFPWNPIGSIWGVSALTLQPAALLGIWGMSFVTVYAAAALASLPDKGAARLVPPLAGALLLLACAAYGVLRLSAAPPAGEAVTPDTLLRIVQPNISQREKWQRDLRAGHVETQLALSLQPAAEGAASRPTHILWSETAIPFLLERSPGLQQSLARAVPPGGYLLAGAPRASADGESYWNSLHVIDGQGGIRATYDKSHLVPFGEYVPLKQFFGWSKLVAGRADFSTGPGRETFDLAGLPPFSPLICYEIIFTARVTPEEGARPAWLLNVTNDNWFGLTSGPHQHLVAARLRAVEEGLPVIRAANGGISAAIDPYGRLLASLPLGSRGVLDVPLPLPLEGATAFSRLQVASLGILLLLGLALWFIAHCLNK
jgi:apolipoprotein N-acyltransferase